ncbi:hypothetical protein [Parasitella parasitica]|uniref:Uncharacterized protein n=1 Tax=Parasitella parasitica TaxID=35722 RepID=A0A0B7NQD4_9FUNG|nr:hypothetical protein [Parasitella parasitica]
MWEDFFRRRRLDEMDSRHFLESYPRNVIRQYDPPVMNNISMGAFTKPSDQQLSNLQLHFSGITHPIDAFPYDLFFRNQSASVLASVAKDFAVYIHKILGDVALQILQLGSDNRLPHSVTLDFFWMHQTSLFLGYRSNLSGNVLYNYNTSYVCMR